MGRSQINQFEVSVSRQGCRATHRGECLPKSARSLKANVGTGCFLSTESGSAIVCTVGSALSDLDGFLGMLPGQAKNRASYTLRRFTLVPLRHIKHRFVPLCTMLQETA